MGLPPHHQIFECLRRISHSDSWILTPDYLSSSVGWVSLRNPTILLESRKVGFRRFDRNRILDAIGEQLTFFPDRQTRDKKVLRDNPVADWQPFRVFYEVDRARRVVRVLAVGVKDRNRLSIGDKEIVI